MKLILSLLIVTIYWCLDAYKAVLNFNIPFVKAFLLDYEQSNPLIKIVIVIAIIIFTTIQTNSKKQIQKVENCTQEELSAIYNITDTILAPLPLHKQLTSVGSKVRVYKSRD